MTYNARTAFSLVELSIVLVILGLLVGGVLSGQSLIRAAELRAVSTEYSRYLTATQTFRDKYFALPGDMTNAFAFWGAATGCTNADINSVATGCNGNGDGAISIYAEGFRFWQHLALASLIEGTYSGTATTNNAVLGGNVPRGRISSTGYQIWSEPWASQGWTGTGSTEISNAIRFGAWGAFGGTAGDPSRISNPSLKCEESWNLDTKIDDGKPGLGRLILHYNVSAACLSTSVRGTAEYILTGNGVNALVDYQHLK